MMGHDGTCGVVFKASRPSVIQQSRENTGMLLVIHRVIK
jgi:hypothetical protein